MKITNFEEIISWQKAKTLNLTLYDIYKDSRDFVFRDQILKAGISIMNNIAEGFERHSDKQFAYFLAVAKGSCGEVRSMNILGRELKKIEDPMAENVNSLCIEISKLINSLINTLSPKPVNS